MSDPVDTLVTDFGAVRRITPAFANLPNPLKNYSIDPNGHEAKITKLTATTAKFEFATTPSWGNAGTLLGQNLTLVWDTEDRCLMWEGRKEAIADVLYLLEVRVYKTAPNDDRVDQLLWEFTPTSRFVTTYIWPSNS